jgi:alcohol dehydrogenase
MRALRLLGDRKLEISESRTPPAKRQRRARCRSETHAVALNHIDVWGWRGMAFAKRKMPLVVGAEASGEIAAVGEGVSGIQGRRSGGALRRAHLRPVQEL